MQNLKEENSGLLFRKGTKKLSSEEVEAQVNGRKYVPLDELESIVHQTGSLLNKAFFTVGVIVDIGRVLLSKNKKAFCNIKLSDL